MSCKAFIINDTTLIERLPVRLSDSNLKVKIAQVFHNQRRQTLFSRQNSIFVDFFGAETQAGAGTTLHEQKDMVNDFELLNYDPHPAIKAPVAV